jgi:hypothetical protein
MNVALDSGISRANSHSHSNGKSSKSSHSHDSGRDSGAGRESLREGHDSASVRDSTLDSAIHETSSAAPLSEKVRKENRKRKSKKRGKAAAVRDLIQNLLFVELPSKS